MSLNGHVSRTLNLLSVEWERHLSEYDAELMPGFKLTATLPFVDVSFWWFGRRPNKYQLLPRRSGRMVWWLGCEFDVAWDNGNDLRLQKYGDAEGLLTKKQRKWREAHVIDTLELVDATTETMTSDSLLVIGCKCGIAVTGTREIDELDGISVLERALEELHDH